MTNKNNDIVFQCVCGKQFEKKTSLTSHKIHCKIYQESVKEEKLKQIQEKESKRLPNGMFKCECCDKEHDGSYGSGRFCSESCK
jgi:predicted restriction endonuclease